MASPNPNGNCHLFVADMQTGATMQLTSWSVGFSEMSAVPEPASVLGTIGLLASGLLLRRRGRTALWSLIIFGCGERRHLGGIFKAAGTTSAIPDSGRNPGRR